MSEGEPPSGSVLGSPFDQDATPDENEEGSAESFLGAAAPGGEAGQATCPSGLPFDYGAPEEAAPGAGRPGPGLPEGYSPDGGFAEGGFPGGGMPDEGMAEGISDEGMAGGDISGGDIADGGMAGGGLPGRELPAGPGGGPVAYGPRPRRRHRVAKVVTGILAVLVLVGALGYVHITHEVNPTGPSGPAVTVHIPAGASTQQIGNLLSRAGVVHGPTVFALYVKLEGAGPLLPGTYHLATNEPYAKVVAALEAGPPLVTASLVVPEGFTIRQIGKSLGRLAGIGISASAFDTAALTGQVRSPYEPARTNSLEGLLFPATYPVRQGEQPDSLVEYMVQTFDYQASQLGLALAAKRLHYSPYQLVTVASIVEREAKFDRDRGPIASVIYNRLARGMPIGAESTLLYWLKDPSGPVDITMPSPYNTLVNTGLPPTPISNPGIPSLEAAINPPKTTYLYWVEINPDGQMGYASTNAGFKHLQHECAVVHLC